MHVLIAYASKHGATAGIANRIADRLTSAGHEVTVRSVTDDGDVSAYHAVVLGSAVYMGHWRKDAIAFARQQPGLAKLPVWLFSSGPIGNARVDDQGRDLRTASVPKELPELAASLQARDHRVFSGALEPTGLTLVERTLRRLPAGAETLPAGDFRDWDDVDQWTGRITTELQQLSPT